MSQLLLNSEVLYQRDYRIPECQTLYDFILSGKCDPEMQKSESTVMVVSLNADLYELNLVGTLVFELLKEGRNQDQITETISALYRMPLETVSVDISNLCRELIKRKIFFEKN